MCYCSTDFGLEQQFLKRYLESKSKYMLYTIGASIFTYTIQGFPYFNYSKIYTQTLF